MVWLLDSSQSVLGRICAAFLALLGFVLIWQTGSRAALVASLLSILFVVARFLRSRYQSLRPVALLAAGLSLLYVVRWQFFSAGSQVPGLKAGSDLGRLLVLKCFSEVPFSEVSLVLNVFLHSLYALHVDVRILCDVRIVRPFICSSIQACAHVCI